MGPYSCGVVRIAFNFLFFLYIFFFLQFHSILECPFPAELSRKSTVIGVICECNEKSPRNHSVHIVSVEVWALLWFYSKIAELWFLVYDTLLWPIVQVMSIVLPKTLLLLYSLCTSTVNYRILILSWKAKGKKVILQVSGHYLLKHFSVFKKYMEFFGVCFCFC